MTLEKASAILNKNRKEKLTASQVEQIKNLLEQFALMSVEQFKNQ
jgi:hypothetical protein